jgi:hypothetical protein
LLLGKKCTDKVLVVESVSPDENPSNLPTASSSTLGNFVSKSTPKNERLLVNLKVKPMPILHSITKTKSGYALRVWEPAETTKDRVRPCLWEINLNAPTIDEFGVVLEQINLLHEYQSQKLEVVPSLMPLPSQDLTKIDLRKSKSESLGNAQPISDSTDSQRFITDPSTEIPPTEVLIRNRLK